MIPMEKTGTLDLSYNGLSGSIPSELGSATMLSKSHLCTVQAVFWDVLINALFKPSMPSGSLSLNANKLTGQVPSELGSLSRLSTSEMGVSLVVFSFLDPNTSYQIRFICRHSTNGVEQYDWRGADRRLRGLFQYLSNVLC
jgi:hypothetical protein